MDKHLLFQSFLRFGIFNSFRNAAEQKILYYYDQFFNALL